MRWIHPLVLYRSELPGCVLAPDRGVGTPAVMASLLQLWLSFFYVHGLPAYRSLRMSVLCFGALSNRSLWMA